MTVARHQQISLEHTPYYHCTSRCVRQAFLCGRDRFSGRNFDHRKQWLEDRLALLSTVFAIDLLAYAIMSNHYHVVIQLREHDANEWSDRNVRERWAKLFSVPKTITPEHILTWRQRLSSLSWYMRCLNEPLARIANREDDCKGRFWQGRFHCQALLDESALIKCMAYVDLNPIRAGTANTPETSEHTSVKARIQSRDQHLLPFRQRHTDQTRSLPLAKCEYLQLLDWSGRQIVTGKTGRIPRQLPPILQRIGSSDKFWMLEMRHYGRWYFRAAGSLESLRQYCLHLGQRWIKGQNRDPVSISKHRQPTPT